VRDGPLAVTRRMSVLPLVGAGFAVVTAIAQGVRRHDATAAALVVPRVAIIVFRHRDNVNRLLRGIEPEGDMAGPGVRSTPVGETR
jgi:hypothetical protein